MANEREPDNPLPADYVPEGAVATHRVSDGEDWASVAAQYNVNVDDLIYFNFHTNVPEEVNWYLRRNVGCSVSNDGDLNWAFSSSADPGIVKMLAMVEDHPASLWYYNPGGVTYYLQLNTTNDERSGMTKGTNGEFPFDGDLGRGFEQFYHEWRVYPFSDIVVQDANQHQSDSSLKLALEGAESSIYKSWQEIANVESRFAVGGGSAMGPLVDAFIKHVYELAETPTHLYYIYQHDEDDS